MKIIAQGRRGTISMTEENGHPIATKTANESKHTGAIRKEYEILHKLNTAGISFVPQLVGVTDDSFSYKRIEGQSLKKQREVLNENQRKHILEQLVHHAYTLDCVGVEHGELSRPFGNILLNDAMEVFILDFERGAVNEFSGRNLKAIGQRLHSLKYISVQKLRDVSDRPLEEIRDTLLQTIQSPPAPTQGTTLAVFLLPLVLVGLDQWTKHLFYDQRVGEDLWLFTPAFNTGIGRSIPVPLFWVALLTVFFLVLLSRRGRKEKNHRVAILLLIAGAVGNLIDRLRLGGVRDFIDLHVWPIFNGADIFISAGVIILLVIESGILNRKSL